MTLGRWATLIDEEAHDNAKQNVHTALNMGLEKYSRVIGNLTEDVAMSKQMDALMSALIVGNLAFDTDTGCVIALGDTGFNLTITLDEDEE